MHAELRVALERVHVVLGMVEDKPLLPSSQQQPSDASQQQGQAAMQQASGQLPAQEAGQLAPDLAAIVLALRRATEANAVDEVTALQRQLAAAFAEGDTTEQRQGQGQSQQVAYEVHDFAELDLHIAKVRHVLTLAHNTCL
jgi:hypothetical protein